MARSKINPVPTSPQTPSHPVNNLATQVGNSRNKKTVRSGFTAHHRVNSSKHLQDANREPEEHSSTSKKTVLSSGFTAHHRVDSSKHLQDANREPEDNKKTVLSDFEEHHSGDSSTSKKTERSGFVAAKAPAKIAVGLPNGNISASTRQPTSAAAPLHAAPTRITRIGTAAGDGRR
jgi:hypothetical protein